MAFVRNLQKYSKGVTMPGGYAHFLPETLQRIDRLWDGKFKSGNKDSTGKRKFFFHSARPLCEDASKNIDISTSMIKLLSIGSGTEKELATWIYERELREWLEEHDFDTFINDATEGFPKYGHIVVKKHRDGVDLVPIENIRTDPAAPWLKYSSFVYEPHRLTRWEIEEMKDWNGNAIQKLFDSSKDQEFDVFECFDLKDDHYEITHKAWYKKPSSTSGGSHASIEAGINQPWNTPDAPIELYKDNMDIEDFPYREIKWHNLPGRWLGLGVMEYLFDNQLHDNETGNMRMRALYLRALKILASDDENIGGNVLRDMVNGQIVRTKGQLKWVSADESDLSAFGMEDSRWDQNANKKTFTFDSMNIPGKINKSMLARLLSQQQNYYKKKRERFGIFIRKLLMEDIMPDFENKTAAEHLFTFSGGYDEMDQFIKFITTAKIERATHEYIAKTGFAPNSDERLKEMQRIEQDMKSKSQHSMKIPKGFYQNLKKKVRMVITGENEDTEGETQWLMQLMQLVGQNPAVLQNKTMRIIVFKVLEMAGIQPGDLNLLNESLNASEKQGTPQSPQGQQPQPPQAQGGQSPQGGAPQQLRPGAPMPKMNQGQQGNAPAMAGGSQTIG